MLINNTFTTPAGCLKIDYDEHFIYRAIFTNEVTSSESILKSEKIAPLTRTIIFELERYADDPLYRFQLPLKPHGTPYQQKVWNALLVIPGGRTLTYGELSATLQSSPRAIGQACRKNPITLLIPCHRIVGKNSQGGYMGSDASSCYKTALLRHEGVR